MSSPPSGVASRSNTWTWTHACGVAGWVRRPILAARGMPAVREPSRRRSPRPSRTPRPGSNGIPRAAFDLLKQRRYQDAIRGFEDLLTRYPNDEFADNARYWLGEANYVERNYQAALIQFQRVTADHPLSPKVPGALLKIGYIHYEQGDWQQARQTLQEILDGFPDTTEARLAESRLERMTRERR